MTAKLFVYPTPFPPFLSPRRECLTLTEGFLGAQHYSLSMTLHPHLREFLSFSTLKDEESEAQSGSVAYTRAHSRGTVEPRCEQALSAPESMRLINHHVLYLLVASVIQPPVRFCANLTPPRIGTQQ